MIWKKFLNFKIPEKVDFSIKKFVFVSSTLKISQFLIMGKKINPKIILNIYTQAKLKQDKLIARSYLNIDRYGIEVSRKKNCSYS